MKVYRYSAVFLKRHVVVSFETNDLREVGILHYLHNNLTIPTSKFKKAVVL